MNFLVLTADLNKYATGICAYIVCQELTKRGHKVNVINLCMSANIQNNGYLTIYNEQTDWIRRNIYLLDQKKHKLLAKALKVFHSSLIQIKSLFTLVPPFSRAPIYYSKAVEFLKNNTCDLIIAVVNPMESIIAAQKISRKYNIPYCAYFLDSIYGSNGVRILSHNCYRTKALRYENKYLEGAEKIFMMNSSKGFYEQNNDLPSFLNKIEYVDIPFLFNRPNKTNSSKTYWDSNQFVILFVGTMPRNIRNPRFTLSLLKNIAKDDIHIYFVGSSYYMNDLDKAIKENHNIHYLGFVDYGEIGNIITNADLLINIGNSISTMLPSKIFEYMSYNKPILNIIKCTNDKTINYLDYYGKCISINESANMESSISKLNQFISNIRQGYFDNQNNINDLMQPGQPLFLNTPKCICQQFESIHK